MNRLIETLREKPCDGFLNLEQFDTQVIREMYGICLKHILAPKCWGDDRPIQHFRKFRGSDLRQHPLVRELHEQFRNVTHDELLRNDALSMCVRWIIRWDKALRRNARKKAVRLRKKRLRKLIKDFDLKLKRSRNYKKSDLKGARYFGDAVVREFFVIPKREGRYGR